MSSSFDLQVSARETAVITATAGQTTIAITFPFQSVAELVIYKEAVDGTRSTLTAPSGFTATGAGSSAGGTATLTTPAAAGEKYRVAGSATIDRRSDMTVAGRYNTAALEGDLDKGVIIDAELKRDLGRTLRAHPMDPAMGPLPAKALRLGKRAVFDATSGDMVVADEFVPATGSITGLMSAADKAKLDTLAAGAQLAAAYAFAQSNIYPASLNGITPGMSGFSAALNALMASVAAAGGGVIELQEGTYTASSTIDNCYDGVLVRGPYMPVLNDSGVSKYGARIRASFAGTLAKRRSPYGPTLRKTRGGGFVNLTLDGGGIATKCLEIDSVAFIDVAVFVTGCVGSVAVETICGVTGTDLGEAADVQFCNIYLIGRLIDTLAEQSCGIIKFGGSSNANTSLNKNLLVYGQHKNGDAVHFYNSDNNEVWVYASRVSGGTGYGVRAGGARAGGILGSENNTIKFLTGQGGAYAEGTGDAGVTAGVFNTIETLDKSNGTPDPTAGTGSNWRWDTGRGVARGLALGPVVIADTDANAIAERAAFAAGRSLVIRNGSEAHLTLTDGTDAWALNIVAGGNLFLRRLAGSGLVRIPNNVSIAARNAADSGDIAMVRVNASDRVFLAGEELIPWTAWTPTITLGSGALESSTIVHARYRKIGRTVFWSFSVRLKNDGAGTGAGYVRFTTPVTPAYSGVGSGYGTIDGHAIRVLASTSGYLELFRTNAGSVIKDAAGSANVDTYVVASGCYEVAA